MKITDDMVKAATSELDAQATHQMQPGNLEKASRDEALVWAEGYFDVRKILEAAISAQ